jgi:membrane protein implicated in regulation of membrane protease activity
MNARTIKTTACTLTAGLFLTGCEGLTPEGNAAVFGSLSGIGAGVIAHNAGASRRETAAIALATGAVVAATVYVIAKRKANERQRVIAEQRARESAARMEARRQKDVAAGKSKKAKSRYIAVDTVKDEKSTGAKTVMIFDTKSQEIVGNNVYDVKEAPAKGSVAKFDTYSAEYVGTGV